MQGKAIVISATVSVPAGAIAPTGTFNFIDGFTSIGNLPVTNSAATLTLSSLAPGTHAITVVYQGDFFDVESQSAVVNVVVNQEDVLVSATPDPLVVKAGHSGTQTLTVSALNGFTGIVSFGCPTNPNYVSCSFSPTTLRFDTTTTSGTVLLTVYTDAAHTASVQPPTSFLGRNGASLAMLFWLPGSALALVGLRRKSSLTRRYKSLLTLVLLVAALGSTLALSGCGGNNNNFATAQTGSYSFPVNITASDGTSQILTTNITIQ